MKKTYLLFALISASSLQATTTQLAVDESTTATQLYDVSSINQNPPPNLAQFNSGASVTLIPVKGNNSPGSNEGNLGQGALLNPKISSMQEDKAHIDNNESVLALLTRDPSSTVNLAVGKRIVLIDTGTDAEFNDFILKAFNDTRSMVTVETSEMLNVPSTSTVASMQPKNTGDNWTTVLSNFKFDQNSPLNINMKDRIGRYIKITFDTTVAGPVGSLRITGKRRTVNNIGAALENANEPDQFLGFDSSNSNPSGKPPSISRVTHVTSGSLANVDYLIDEDFRTVYTFEENKPIAFIVKAQNHAELGIDRISLLFANDHANGINPGIVDVYALDQLPFMHTEAAKGDEPSVQLVTMAQHFFAENTPVTTITVAPGSNGAVGRSLQSPIRPNYLLFHVTTPTGTPGGQNTPLPRNISSIYAGPTQNMEKQLLSSQSLFNRAQGLSNLPTLNQLPPRIPVTPTGGTPTVPAVTPPVIPPASPIVP